MFENTDVQHNFSVILKIAPFEEGSNLLTKLTGKLVVTVKEDVFPAQKKWKWSNAMLKNT